MRRVGTFVFYRLLRRDRFRLCDWRAVAALGVVAQLDVAFLLRLFLHQVRRAALRAGTGDGLVVHRKVALWITGAGVEDATARTAFDDVAFAARRALHAGRLRRRRLAAADLADVAAVGITGAAVERAVSAA